MEVSAADHKINGGSNAAKSVNAPAVNGQTNTDSVALPHSFLEGKAVRTVYGLVPLNLALDWPVSASYNELSACASWMGGRIPTFEESRSLYEYVCVMKRGEAERKLGKTVPAVNG